jgi:hypothetical protein
MTKIVITEPKRYAVWLAKHLAKEHPKTRGKIKIIGGKR